MTDATLHIDFETRSTVDLRAAGVYRYAMDPYTDLWCAAYAFDDEPTEVWLPGSPMPERIHDHVRGRGRILAWNAQFERIIWKCILSRRYGWAEPKLEQWHCPMTWALAMGLPASLGGFGQAMTLVVQKDDAGRRRMLQMAKPRDISSAGEVTWWDSPDRVAQLVEYCRRDVETERAAVARLVPLAAAEREIWLIDQRINDRGVKVDVPFVAAGQTIILRRLAKLNDQMSRATSHYVGAASEVARIGEWLVKRGFPMASLDKASVSEALAGDLPSDVRKVLTIRQQASRSSTAKLNAFEAATCNDSRIRGLFMFHKAATGRWASGLVQVHNLPRGSKHLQQHYDEVCSAINFGDDDWLEVDHGDPMDAVSATLRGCLIPGLGKIFAIRDYSAIEARKLAWLAGEEWKLEAFREYDAGTGVDQYRLAYARMFDCDPEAVTSEQRQIGKTLELAMGYQGGVAAFQTMAGTTGLDLAAMAESALPVIDADLKVKAAEAYLERGTGSGMSEDVWVACESLKVMWREAHPAIRQFWRELEVFALNAVQNPGETYSIDPSGIKFRVANGHLWCRLPSGRLLCYPFPAIQKTETPWGAERRVLSCMTMAPGNQWVRRALYGGLLAENVTQASSADLLRRSLVECEAANLPVVLHVHDEIVCEVPTTGAEDALAKMGTIMGTAPAWAKTMPISSSGFLSTRYRKG